MEIQRLVKRSDTTRLWIDLPVSLLNRKLEILVIPMDEPKRGGKRRPPVELAGKVKESGCVMSSVPASDWGIEER